ncbi:MAG: thiamine pyrophosphate-binding protein [Pirellulaceae bacterium]|nr:thiamine pyrophosphate-binding protein [Pirellulaceae bacterium]
MSKPLSLGKYLLDQLGKRGVQHIFGVPGDYVLRFYDLIEHSPLQHIGTTREDAAGFAADAYARVRGLGAVCVTYCVGGLNLANPVAGAYAEKSPIVVISGAPGLKERERNPLLHHRVRDFSTQREVFERLTVASAALEDPVTAYHEIDRVLQAVERYKRPGYIELPRDMVDVVRPHRPRPAAAADAADAAALDECLEESLAMLNGSRQPVILAGVEVHRFGLQEALVQLVERARIPVAATLLGKSVISEDHPLYLGVYEGAMGHAEVQRYVETADCVLMLGCFMTDINLGIYTANLEPSRTIYATSERTSIRRHQFGEVPLSSFLQGLLQASWKRRARPRLPPRAAAWGERASGESRITIRALFQRLNEFLTPDMVVIADIGDSLFGAADLTIHRRTEFISPAYYTSMGFAVPASVGAQLANSALRPLVIVGDGAFQMTGLELSTTARLGLNPIVIVLNNHGYGTERQIGEGPFNDITNWSFSKVPELLGSGWGFVVRTVADLEQALQASLANRDAFSIIEVDLDKYDTSPALTRLGQRLSQRVKGKTERNA